MEGNKLAGNQFLRHDHQYSADATRRRQDGDRSNIDQMTVLGLLNLVQAITASFADLAHSHGNVKLIVQAVAKLFGNFAARVLATSTSCVIRGSST